MDDSIVRRGGEGNILHDFGAVGSGKRYCSGRAYLGVPPRGVPLK